MAPRGATCDPGGAVWFTLLLCLGLVAAPAPHGSGESPPSPTPVGPTQIATRRLVVHTTAAEFEVLRTELAARWPDAEILPYGAAAFTRVAGRAYAYLEVLGEPVGDAPIAITLIISDGRAYTRQVVPGEGGRARVLAVGIANLLVAVTDEDVVPDRVDASVPLPPATAAVVEPAAAPAPVAAPPRAVADVPRAPVQPRERWQLGVGGSGALLLGVAPPPRRGRPNFGGAVGLDARAPRGLAVGASLRLVGDSALAYRLVRTRVQVHVGYIGRAGQVEYAVLAGPTVEPWRVSRAGRGLALGSREGRGVTVLYGASVRGAVGYTWRVPERPLRARVGIHSELATSVLASRAAARVRLGDAPEPLFTLGGVEIMVGVDAVLWFDLARRRSTATRPRRARAD